MRAIDGEHGDRPLTLKFQELGATPVAFGRLIWEGHAVTVLPVTDSLPSTSIVEMTTPKREE
jgi:hypothetical protein